MRGRGPRLAVAVLCAATLAVAACSSPASTSATHTAGLTTSTPSVASTSTPDPTPKPTPRSTPRPTPRSSARAATTSPRVTPPSSTAPVIVIDPGHSPSIHASDPSTGLDVSDYENEPEMRDVFAVAELVKAKLQADGYHVIMTKSAVTSQVSLGQRAAIANAAHAALALSIHDQAGSNGGLAFHAANNNVYYQSVGTYRETPAGKKIYFTDSQVAALSKKYGAIFQSQRADVEHHPVRLLGNTGYDLGSRGLAPGNIWLVQLLSHVPWIYNEAGGNSAGMSGLDPADRQAYADGLVAGVEHCIAPPG